MARRGVGTLNNELYVGRLVWNRLRYLKDPDTGKRVPRLNPESEWVIQEVPEMRIIDQEVWNVVKARQQSLAYETSEPGENALNDRRRPKHLFCRPCEVWLLWWGLYDDLERSAWLHGVTD